MEAEKLGGLSSKVIDSKINGRGNKFKLFTFETEFTERNATPTNVTGRIKQFAITQNDSGHRKLIYFNAKSRAWAGGWLEHTKHVQPVHYIYIYI